MDAERKPPQTSGADRHLAGSILSVGASRSVMLVSVAVTSVAITRLLGPSGIGTYAISASLLYVFTILFELGMSQGTAYYVGRGEWSGRALAHGVLSACLLLGVSGSLVAIAAYALFGDLVPGLTWPMAIALAAAIPFSLIWRIAPQAALGRQRFELFGLFDLSPWLLSCLISIPLAVVADTSGAVIGYAIAVAISGIAAGTWLLRGPGREEDSVAPPRGARAVASFGSRVWLTELLLQVNLRADLVLLGAFAGAAQGGVYSVALSTTAIAWVLTEAFAISALPRSARLHGAGELAHLSDAHRTASDARMIRHAVMVIPAIALLELLLLFVGIPLFYGSEFHRSIELGLILLPGSLLLGAGRAGLAILLARGLTGKVLLVGVAIVPATVLAYVLILPSAGATGAAIISSASYLAYTLLALLMLRAAMGIAARSLVVPERADLADYRDLLSKAGRYVQDVRRA